MRIVVIADEDTALGFRFAGAEGRVVESPSEALAALKEVSRLPDVGIVVLTERIARELRSEIDRVRYEARVPLVLEIPGPEGPLPDRRTMLDLIREAVGVSI
ncbi:MAG: V-type ATP synthase subunit F [Planctomycetota bacterium]